MCLLSAHVMYHSRDLCFTAAELTGVRLCLLNLDSTVRSLWCCYSHGMIAAQGMLLYTYDNLLCRLAALRVCWKPDDM
jgi:hypothetical protein